jgi:hypothetical protein
MNLVGSGLLPEVELHLAITLRAIALLLRRAALSAPGIARTVRVFCREGGNR